MAAPTTRLSAHRKHLLGYTLVALTCLVHTPQAVAPGSARAEVTRLTATRVPPLAELLPPPPSSMRDDSWSDGPLGHGGLSPLTDAPSAMKLPPATDADWLSTVQHSIAASEYHIRFQEQAGALQSPNRAQDLRITYHTDGFSLTPRVNADAWHTELRLVSIGRDEERFMPTAMPAIVVRDSSAVVDHGAFRMHYTNSEHGMRQDFQVKERPAGSGPLTVRLHYTGTLHATAQGEDDILFSEADTVTGAYVPRVWYRDLKVWDAHQRELEARAYLEDGLVELAVYDVDAAYPITIDPLSTTADWVAAGVQANAQFGQDVHTAGDVNGDGFSDVIVGAPLYDGGLTNQGAAYVFLGSATGLASTPAWSRTGTPTDGIFGTSVSTAGDVNGDGFSDVIVGAPNDNTGGAFSGRAFLYTGSGTGLTTTPRIMSTNVVNDQFGLSVAGAGDVNGDGYSDVIVGAPGRNSGSNGRVYVFHGGSGTFDTANDWNVTGSAENFGFSVSSAGDANGDGYSDIIIGGPTYSNPDLYAGRAVAFRGSASGVLGSVWLNFTGDKAQARVGNSVSWAGDVNGDGYGDVIVGASVYQNDLINEGRAYVLHGYAGGINPTPVWIGEGDAAQANFGIEVSGAGDVNGDGYADVIVGAQRYDILRRGMAYVYYGGSGGTSTTPQWTVTGAASFAAYGYSVCTAGDVNGDGYADVIVGALDVGGTAEGHAYVYHGSPEGLSTTASTRNGAQDSSRLGWSVSTAGDVNGDGYSDVIIGAPLFDNGQTDEGCAYLYLGGATGLSGTTAWNTESNQNNAQFGYCVSTAGDVNGDGYSDVIIGAPYYDNGETDEGRAYLFHGINAVAGLSASPAATRESDQVNAHFGWSVNTAGDVNGDGYSDVIIGAPDYDNGQTDEGRAFVYRGSSTGITAVAWTTESDQASAQLGTSVAGGGDVNGDGYGDVIIGVPLYDGSFTNEGQARIHAGWVNGVVDALLWTARAGKSNASFGASVAMAGDVDGNGRTDVIIGAPLFDVASAISNEGRAYVFLAGANSPAATPVWTADGGVADANFGFSVSKAGDVNGDGYGDIVVGAPDWGNGRVRVYHGTPAGPEATPALDQSGTQAGQRLGACVSNSGSQSGDGYGDVVVGSPRYDVTILLTTYTDRGRAYIYTGNAGRSLTERTHQYRPDLTTPVQPSNGTFGGACGWGIGQFARSPLGRRQMKLAWEVTGHGPPFAGTPVTNSAAYTAQSAAWTNVPLAGVEIKQAMNTTGSAYPKWRVRVRHHPATMLDGQPFGRWHYFGIHDRQEPAIKTTTPTCGLLPVELIAFHAYCEGHAQKLAWTTASEQNSSHFTVQRSSDGTDWTDIGRVEAAGNSQQLVEYGFTDRAPLLAQVAYYRIQQVDLNGNATAYDAAVALPCSTDDATLVAYPNPATDEVHVIIPAGMWAEYLVLTDGTGRALRSILLPEADGTNIRFPLDGLAPGLYHIALSGTPYRDVKPVRIIKQ